MIQDDICHMEGQHREVVVLLGTVSEAVCVGLQRLYDVTSCDLNVSCSRCGSSPAWQRARRRRQAFGHGCYPWPKR